VAGAPSRPERGSYVGGLRPGVVVVDGSVGADTGCSVFAAVAVELVADVSESFASVVELCCAVLAVTGALGSVVGSGAG
jgi:hypothetical protein